MEEGTGLCCGMIMQHKDYWNVRVYSCSYRAHHPKVFVNLATGEVMEEQ